MNTFGRYKDGGCYICGKPTRATYYGRDLCHKCLKLAVKKADIISACMGRGSHEQDDSKEVGI